MARYFFIMGHATRESAHESMLDSFADGEIDESQMPRVQRYETRASVPSRKRYAWGVSLVE